jgi:hypothetical protein
MRRIARGEIDFVIVDDYDSLTPGVARSVHETAATLSIGFLITASTPGPWIHQAPFNATPAIRLRHLDERREDILPLAELFWEEVVGHGAELLAHCDDACRQQFEAGPWPLSSHSLRRCIELLVENCLASGALQGSQLLQTLSNVEIQDAILGVLRETLTIGPEQDLSSFVLVVEGETDVTYLKTAAHLCIAEFQHDPLSEIEVVPAGQGRDGGATNAVATLIRLAAEGRTAIGLFDNDELGERGKKDARKFGQRGLTLPAEFAPFQGPAGRQEFEIEDLLPSGLLMRFYDENPELSWESRTERDNQMQIVIKGVDKEGFSQWVTQHVSFNDIIRIAYVLYWIRDEVGLHVPDTIPDRKSWLRDLVKTDNLE